MPDGGNDAPLAPDVQVAVSSGLATMKAALAASCCGAGRDPLGCASIIDPASCGPDEEVQTDARLGVPATVGQLRAVASFAQAKRTAARTSTELLTRNITQTAGRVSAMCEELSAVLTTAP